MKYLKKYESFSSVSITDRYTENQILEIFQELEDDFEFVMADCIIDEIVLTKNKTNTSELVDIYSGNKYQMVELSDSVSDNLYVYQNSNAYLLQLYSTNHEIDSQLVEIKRILDDKSETYDIKYILSTQNGEYRLIIY